MYVPEGILLGLSTGIACIAFCGPVLVPYLMAESHSVRHSFLDVSWFLLGRFIAYIITGILAGMVGSVLFKNKVFLKFTSGWLYILLAISMVIYAVYRTRHVCLGEAGGKISSKIKINWPHLLPVFGGFTSGINLCPPFVLAITQASLTKSILESTLFFIAFFVGTSVYFIPLPFISYFRKNKEFRQVGKFAAGIVGIIYLYKGITALFY